MSALLSSQLLAGCISRSANKRRPRAAIHELAADNACSNHTNVTFRPSRVAVSRKLQLFLRRKCQRVRDVPTENQRKINLSCVLCARHISTRHATLFIPNLRDEVKGFTPTPMVCVGRTGLRKKPTHTFILAQKSLPRYIKRINEQLAVYVPLPIFFAAALHTVLARFIGARKHSSFYYSVWSPSLETGHYSACLHFCPLSQIRSSLP